MAIIRIALASMRFPSSPEETVELAIGAITDASDQQVGIICFPEQCCAGRPRTPATSQP